LNFSGSSPISDSGIKKVAQSLGKAMEAQVSLRFGKVSKVPEAGRERFVEVLTDGIDQTKKK